MFIFEDDFFFKVLFFEFRLLDDDKDFVESRDSCLYINKIFIYGFLVGGEEFWLVVVF